MSNPLAKLSALPSGPAYADMNFGGDPEEGGYTGSSYAADSVVLTLEFLSDGSAKFLVFLLRMSMLSSFILLILQLWWKLDNDASTLAYSDTILVINLVVAILSVLLLLLAGGFYVFGTYKAYKEGKRWNARRKRYCILGGFNFLAQFFVSTFFLACNAYGLMQPCSWFLLNIQVLSFMRWSFFAMLVALQILQALILLPTDALPWYKGKAHVGLDLPAKTYFYIFMIFFIPLELMQFLRFGAETNWFSSEYLCQKFYNASCQVIDFSTECKEKKYPCYYNEQARLFSILSIVLFLVECAVYFAMILFTRRQLKRLPYQEHRISYIELGFQLQTRIIAVVFYILSLILYSAVRPSTCGTLIFNSMGNAPMQIVFATLVLFQVVLATPDVQFKASKIKLHAWLQDFAWLERDIEPKLAARPFQGEPCFCYETSLKMFYFCNLIYDLDEVPDSPYTLEAALELYNLTHYRILFHKKQDAKCLAAWNPETRTIVFSFRGTASMANVLADIKVWRRPHPPERGQYFLFNQPMVHVGFLQTWGDSGMKDEVLALLNDVLNGGDGSCGKGEGDGYDGSVHVRKQATASTTTTNTAVASGSVDPPVSQQQQQQQQPQQHIDDSIDQNKTLNDSSSQAPWRVFATGHSLGGALAHLCSHDICTTIGDRARLTCTTFGAPRPGNHAFARSFRATVLDAWDIFHPDDAVARAGKFIVLYKRAANTIIISPAGELVVRPTYAEQSVRRGFSPRLAEHLLTKYAHSLGAILKAAINHEGKEDLINEAKPLPYYKSRATSGGGGSGGIDGGSGSEVRMTTSTEDALRSLFKCGYVQQLLRNSRVFRQGSLLRITGASPSEIERAQLEMLEGDDAAASVNGTGNLNCGNCLSDGVVFSWLPTRADVRGMFRWNKSDMELHVQD